jgi:hypothetical protein
MTLPLAIGSTLAGFALASAADTRRELKAQRALLLRRGARQVPLVVARTKRGTLRDGCTIDPADPQQALCLPTVRGLAGLKPWSKSAPMTKRDRERLALRCKPAKCFAKPKTRSYPMCRKKSNVCRVDCDGAKAAFSRARQQGDDQVAKVALKAGIKNGCSWTETGKSARAHAKKWKLR